MSQEINQRILDALNEGYNPQDILSAFSMSKDPEHQSWYENYSQTMRDRARETNMLEQRAIPGKPGLGITQRIKQHVEETPGEQLIGEAALAAGGLYAGKRLLQKAFPTPGEQGLAEQNKIARERLELAKNPVLSPLEEARLETEKAKAELQRKRIEILDRQLAKAEAGKQLSPADQSLLNLYEQQRAAKQATAQTEINKQMGFAPPGAPTAQPPVAGGQPPAPPAPVGAVSPQNRIPGMMAAQEMSNPLGGLASAYTEPLRPPTVEPPAAAIPPATEEKTKTRKPKTKLTYEAGSQLPEGMVFKEGFGGADNWMKNSFNDESRIMIRDLFNEGKPYGQNMEKAYNDARKYEDWLKQNIPVQTYARTERKAAGLPPPENYGKLGTAIKVGGIGGLLMTAGQAANAKQAAQNVGEALLPISMTPSELASGTLTKKQLEAYKEAQKLGSPYRSVPPR